MGIVVMISAALVSISILVLLLINGKNMSNLRTTCIIVLVTSGFVGLMIFPALMTIKTDYVKIDKHDYQVIRGESNLILRDVSNDNKIKIGDNLNGLIPFNSYDIMTKYDSTKTNFYFMINRSFYNVPINRKIVWSNPPYNIFQGN